MKSTLRALIVGALIVCSSPLARAANQGFNFDGIMSLIYDSNSGGVFVENAPNPNPSVRRIKIASLSGMLLPGPLPSPAPPSPITILSQTVNLIDFAWSGGNFLGTGSALGAILPAGLSPFQLQNDLTIQYQTMIPVPPLTPGAPYYTGDFLYITNTPGSTQNNPILPNAGNNGFFRFFNVASGQFMDPPTANAYLYTMDTPGSVFTKVGLPVGLGNNFTITSTDGVASNLGEGSLHSFSSAVTSFQIKGITPPVDGNLPNAFPVYLEFSTATASFSMQAQTVPEPATVTLLGACALMGLSRRRRYVR